jgi:hypothetical protein
MVVIIKLLLGNEQRTKELFFILKPTYVGTISKENKIGVYIEY